MGEYLSWDSDFFGYAIHKIILDSPLSSYKSIDDYIRQHHPDLIYFFSATEQPLLTNRTKLIDTKITFNKIIKLSSGLNPENDFIIQPYTGEMNHSLEKLAWESGWHSRFKKDALLHHKFENLYSLWMKNSLDKKIADEVFVCFINKEIAGMVTVRQINKSAKIGIIAVYPEYKGKGVGKALMLKTEEWCKNRQINDITVITQKQNVNTCIFYQTNGYSIEKVEYIYHYWINKSNEK